MTAIATSIPTVDRTPLVSLRSLHLFTICAFAISQPLLTAITRQSVFLHDQQVGWLEIGFLLMVLQIALPLCVLGVDQIVLRLSRRFKDRGKNSVFGILFCILMLSLLRPYVSIDRLLILGYAGYVALCLAITCSYVLVRFYDRVAWLRSWLTFASLGLVIFPANFLWQFQAIHQVETSTAGSIAVKNPVPVVLVVFDEFSGITLHNEKLEIDSQRFPQFARLAGLSTWYRNATTVHPRTDIAVPTILSGRFPVVEHSPLPSEYPGNLFQVIEATKVFDMAVFEPVSRLCPDSVQYHPKPTKSLPEKCVDLILTAAAVYPRLILTSDTPIDLPLIPKAWFGLSTISTWDWEQLTFAKNGLFRYPGTEHRKQLLQHFLSCLETSGRPRFHFMHTVLPHYPWSFFPSGDQYQSEFAAPLHPAAAHGELGEDWENDPANVIRNEYRYRLQAGYVDRFIGQLIDRLETSGLLDQCLLIVTADHGVSFRPGHSRRLPDADNLADIVSVPLFIKLPGQTASGIDDRNVESIDLLPTIAEVLGLELPEPVDGLPVSIEQRRPRKTLYFQSKMTIIEPDLPQRLTAARRQAALFGSDPLETPPKIAARHPDWHGHAVSEYEIDERPLVVDFFNTHNLAVESSLKYETELLPNLISGSLAPSDLPVNQAELVLAVDGIVVDTGTTCRGSQFRSEFQFLIPPSSTAIDLGKVEVYFVEALKPKIRLRPLTLTSESDQSFQKRSERRP